MSNTDWYLRSATLQDKDKIYQLLCLPEVFKYLADGQAPPPSVTSTWLNSAVGDRANYGGGLWVLVDGTDQRINGVVRLASDDSGELELIYLLHPSCWGLGLATRMAHTVIAQAFEAGLVSSIWAGADVPNKASIAVIRRLGMEFWREVQYSLGAGVEYQIHAANFDPASFELLPIA